MFQLIIIITCTLNSLFIGKTVNNFHLHLLSTQVLDVFLKNTEISFPQNLTFKIEFRKNDRVQRKSNLILLHGTFSTHITSEKNDIISNDTKKKEQDENSYLLEKLRKNIFLGFIIIIIIQIIIFLILLKLTSKNRIINLILRSQRINDKFNLNSRRTTTVHHNNLNLAEENNSKVRNTQNQIEELNSSTENQNKQSQETSTHDDNTVIYLRGQRGNRFEIESRDPDECFFGYRAERDGIAELVFTGDEKKAIANRVFTEDICIITSGTYNQATKVKVESPGKIKRINNYWEVIEKIKIKFE